MQELMHIQHTSETAIPAISRINITVKIVQPCLTEPTIFPYVNVSAAGISKIASISRKLLKGVGFSKGCALLALKKPPPFVPSCLIASWDADRTHWDYLLSALNCPHCFIGFKVLDHTLPCQDYCKKN